MPTFSCFEDLLHVGSFPLQSLDMFPALVLQQGKLGTQGGGTSRPSASLARGLLHQRLEGGGFLLVQRSWERLRGGSTCSRVVNSRSEIYINHSDRVGSHPYAIKTQ